MFSQYIMYGLGGIIVLLLVASGVQTARLKSCQGNLVKAKASVVELQGVVKQRDAILEDVAAKGREAQERAKQAEINAEKIRVVAQKRVNDLVAEKVPTNSDEQVKYMYNVTGKLNKLWEGEN